MIAAIVVVATVVLLATGRGGGLSIERNDYVPLDLGPVSATDVALLRPPTGLWGYNMQATDEAMDQIAESIRERDVRIVALEQLVTDLSRDHAPMPLLASPYSGARHRRAPLDATEPDPVQAPPRRLPRRSRSGSPSTRPGPVATSPARRSSPMTDIPRGDTVRPGAPQTPMARPPRRGRWPGRTAGSGARGG